MRKEYIINVNTHEVHKKQECKNRPLPQNEASIGLFDSAKNAIIYASLFMGYKNADGCYYCCPEAHSK